MKYIALLRGVNVGGNNKLSMKELAEELSQNGFESVKTYINSGNILFTHKQKDCLKLAALIKNCIKNRFNLDITTMVITGEELQDALSNAPDWWDGGEDSKHNGIFVIPPATAGQVCAEIGDTKPEYEKVIYKGKLIFWSAPVKTFSRTRWAKVSSTAAYSSITIRNRNTTIKLCELAKE